MRVRARLRRLRAGHRRAGQRCRRCPSAARPGRGRARRVACGAAAPRPSVPRSAIGCRPGQTVAISVCDGTRPQPRHLMVPAVLDELDGIVDPDDVVVLVATGTHRGNTAEELEAMLGRDVLDRVRVVNHDCRDDDSLRVGRAPRGRRARVAQPGVDRRRRPDHDRVRRAALLRRVQRRARRWWRPGSPASRPCSLSTTPAASVTRGPRGV